MRVLLWHVHGSWTTAFVQGNEEYFLPATPDRGPDGRGRAATWDWPSNVHDVAVPEMRNLNFDVVVLQRPHEVDLLHAWTGRRAGIDVPALYVEHNSPFANPTSQLHPLASRRDIPIVHVTHFNATYWDNGDAPVHVIEHGIIDPGYRWSGELASSAITINEPARRHRVTGSDLVRRFTEVAPVDLFGIDARTFHDRYPEQVGKVRAIGNLPQEQLHDEMARRAVYVHTSRWTSLGLSLLEAMHLGMPIVALAATEATRAVPVDGGVVSTKVDELVEAVRFFLADRDAGARAGAAARRAALSRYSLGRFLDDWHMLWKKEGWI